MWALGVVLFTMLYGQFPFYDSVPQVGKLVPFLSVTLCTCYIWALGVVLFTMLYGQFPFYDSVPQVVTF
jgi:serine/threonine protein kinase